MKTYFFLLKWDFNKMNAQMNSGISEIHCSEKRVFLLIKDSVGAMKKKVDQHYFWKKALIFTGLLGPVIHIK